MWCELTANSPWNLDICLTNPRFTCLRGTKACGVPQKSRRQRCLICDPFCGHTQAPATIAVASLIHGGPVNILRAERADCEWW